MALRLRFRMLCLGPPRFGRCIVESRNRDRANYGAVRFELNCKNAILQHMKSLIKCPLEREWFPR